MKKLKVIAKTETTITLETRGRDGISSLYDLLKGIKGKTFIIGDPDDGDYTKAFFFQKELDLELDEDRSETQKLIVTNVGWEEGLQLLYLFIFLRNNGNVGHSFGIEDNHGNKAGWDGDGADSVIAIYLNDKKLPEKAYSFNDYELQKYFSDNK